MISKVFLIFTFLLGCSINVRSQGTLQFDQQSTTGAIYEGVITVQSSQPTGQSFTPSLNAVGFVQLGLDDPSSANTATVYVNLLANSITGPVVAQTTPVTLSPLSEGIVSFYFPTPATVSPGTTYYLQPVVAAGSAEANVSIYYSYSGGTAFINGTSDPTRNFYFREGIVVPEPSTWALLALAGGALFLRRKK